MSQLPGPDELDEVLHRGPRRQRRRRWLIAAVLAGLAAVGGVWIASALRPAEVTWRTEVVRTEDLQVLITAVGTVEPRDVVDVGSEQSGLVYDVYVDENDVVISGQPLAELDTKVLDLQHRESRAQVAALVASLAQARTVAASRKADLIRLQSLDRGNAVAPADLEQAVALRDQAVASSDAAKAQLEAARARLGLTDANLHKAVIRSPIAGVVLVRNVDPGQSVVAALQAVTLFEVAADLGELLVEVDVDEADVPRVKAGQTAQFTVSAWPEREFPAVVSKVHLAPDTTAGVVTYRAELLAVNPDGALLPGMTATARIEAERHPGALTVPLASLRFAPEGGDELAVLGAGQGRVWRLVDDEPDPVIVELGPTDGLRQAVTGDLSAGEVVVIGRGAK